MKARKHGYARKGRTPEYRTWVGMLQRCTNPKATGYHNYGGRGIKVCPRWKDFAYFLLDMGRRPAGMSLDRFPNPSGDYAPGNCRWATRKQQSQSIRRLPLKWLIGPRMKDKHFQSQYARNLPRLTNHAVQQVLTPLRPSCVVPLCCGHALMP